MPKFYFALLCSLNICLHQYLAQTTSGAKYGAPSEFYALLGFGNKASLVNIPGEAFSCRPLVDALLGHLISSRGSFSVTEDLIGSTVQLAFWPFIPIPNFLASYILGILAG